MNNSHRYFYERRRQDLALRMIGHEARTCTIKACTGLSDDRIRRLCRTYAQHTAKLPVRRRGKAPRRIGFFTRNTHVLFEAACLVSIFSAFGLLGRPAAMPRIELGLLFCDAFETHRQLSQTAVIGFEHAWFLLQQLNEGGALRLSRCRQCQGQYLRDTVNAASCPICRLKKAPTRSRRTRQRSRTPAARRMVLDEPASGGAHARTAQPAAPTRGEILGERGSATLEALQTEARPSLSHGRTALAAELPRRVLPGSRR